MAAHDFLPEHDGTEDVLPAVAQPHGMGGAAVSIQAVVDDVAQERKLGIAAVARAGSGATGNA